jgi:hypothetical protein
MHIVIPSMFLSVLFANFWILIYWDADLVNIALSLAPLVPSWKLATVREKLAFDCDP